MPRTFDNIDQQLLPALRDTLAVSKRADFCVGYFNLRGWKSIDSYIDKWSGADGRACRPVVGMQKAPSEVFLDDIDRFPLRQATSDTLNRQLRGGVSDNDLVSLVLALREEGRLTVSHETEESHEPQSICSLGLRAGPAE